LNYVHDYNNIINYDNTSSGEIKSKIFYIEVNIKNGTLYTMPIEDEKKNIFNRKRIEYNSDLLCKLYFMNYNLKVKSNNNEEYEYKNKYIPLALIPSASKITTYGTYSQFVNVGSYICKVMDYKQQCTSEKCVSKNYSYIGDRYDNCFPERIKKAINIQIDVIQHTKSLF
jgi:hypothetical protein